MNCKHFLIFIFIEKIAKRLASLNSEIESSEKKALKAAGEMVDDVDKENEDQGTFIVNINCN